MANSLCEVLLTEAQLEGAADTAAVTGQGGDVNAGAIVDFWGVVRALEDGNEIDGIEYEVHRAMAEHQLRLIAKEAASKFVLKQITIHHRIGFVPVGDASLFLQVRAQRRAAAFGASGWVVDELKRRVPIWKRPKFKIDNQRERESRLSVQPSSILSRE